MLNQLHSNIAWGQRGNFLSIPTDTPARDERLGWTGDISVFAADGHLQHGRRPAFLDQVAGGRARRPDADGAFTGRAPRSVGCCGDGAAGWGDAGVTVPWTL